MELEEAGGAAGWGVWQAGGWKSDCSTAQRMTSMGEFTQGSRQGVEVRRKTAGWRSPEDPRQAAKACPRTPRGAGVL